MSCRASRVLALLVLCVASGCSSAGSKDEAGSAPEGRTLRLASDVWAPFTDHDGKPRVAIELVLEALRREDVSVRYEIREDFGEVVDDLREGDLDGSGAIWPSPARARFLLYSKAYLENRLVIVGRRGTNVAAGALSVLAGKRVAIVAGYAYGPEVGRARGVEFVFGPNDLANLRRLLDGEVDYVLVDEFVVHHLLEDHREEARQTLAIGTKPLVKRSLHFAVRRDLPGAEALIAGFNKRILSMQADGTYNRTLRLDWVRADVDGDGTPEFVRGGARAGASEPEKAYDIFSEDKSDSTSAFYIDGTRYESWDQVPDRHRRDPGSGSSDTGAVLLEFDF